MTRRKSKSKSKRKQKTYHASRGSSINHINIRVVPPKSQASSSVTSNPVYPSWGVQDISQIISAFHNKPAAPVVAQQPPATPPSPSGVPQVVKAKPILTTSTPRVEPIVHKSQVHKSTDTSELVPPPEIRTGAPYNTPKELGTSPIHHPSRQEALDELKKRRQTIAGKQRRRLRKIDGTELGTIPQRPLEYHYPDTPIRAVTPTERTLIQSPQRTRVITNPLFSQRSVPPESIVPGTVKYLGIPRSPETQELLSQPSQVWWSVN